EVTVLSRTTAKAADAKSLGAVRHVATSEPDALRGLRNEFDVLLNTVSADLDLTAYLRTVKPRGVLANVGLPTNDYAVRPGVLVGNSRVVAGSNIGGIPETREMLAFAAEHGIGATIEVIDAA